MTKTILHNFSGFFSQVRGQHDINDLVHLISNEMDNGKMQEQSCVRFSFRNINRKMTVFILCDFSLLSKNCFDIYGSEL